MGTQSEGCLIRHEDGKTSQTCTVLDGAKITNETLSENAPRYMKNLDYVLAGYDIFFGNPATGGASPDPGYRQHIFRADYGKNSLTADRRFKVPSGMTIRSCGGSCEMSFSSELIAGTKSYQKDLSTKVSADFKGFGASFSASTEFKSMQQTNKAHSTFYTMTEAKCCVYTASLNDFDAPPLSENFLIGVKRLPQN